MKQQHPKTLLRPLAKATGPLPMSNSDLTQGSVKGKGDPDERFELRWL